MFPYNSTQEALITQHQERRRKLERLQIKERFNLYLTVHFSYQEKSEMACFAWRFQCSAEQVRMFGLSSAWRAQPLEKKSVSFPTCQHSKAMNKTITLVRAPYSSCYPKLPGHVPLSEPTAIPQPSSPAAGSHFSSTLLSPLQRISPLTIKPRNQLSPTLTVFDTRDPAAGSPRWQHPHSEMLAHWLDLFSLPLSQQMRQGHIIPPSVRAAPFAITEACLDSITFCPMLWHLDEGKWWRASTLYKDPSKHTKQHNFHRSRGSLLFNNLKCRSNGAYEPFSSKIQ